MFVYNLKVKIMKFKYFINEITIDLWSSWYYKPQSTQNWCKGLERGKHVV